MGWRRGIVRMRMVGRRGLGGVGGEVRYMPIWTGLRRRMRMTTMAMDKGRVSLHKNGGHM
jgi:hypothetical protein